MARPTRFAAYPFPSSGFATTKGGNIDIGSNANTVVIVRGGENEVTPDTLVGCTLNAVAMTALTAGTRSGGGDIQTYIIDSSAGIGSGSVPILLTASDGNSRLGLCVEVWHDCGGSPRYEALAAATKSSSASPSHTVTADADSSVVLMSSVSSGIVPTATAPTTLGANSSTGSNVADFALIKDGAASTTLNWTYNFADATFVQPIKLNGVPGGPVITGPSGAAGAASSTANLAEVATTGPTFTTSVALGVGYPNLTGADAASFAITALSSTSWRVDPVTPFNFESLPHSNPFNVTFNASASVSQTCAITITNVNEAPGFSGTISVPGLTESVAMSAINAALLFSDPDSGDTGTYSAVGTFPTGVTVSSGGLISGTPGAGTAATYSSLRVRRTDGGGLTADSNVFSITVSASGAPPGVTTQPSNQTVTEGGVATLTAAFSNSPTGFAWEFADTPYSSWSPVVGGSGAATASYTTGALLLANNARRFRCTGTNAFGSTTTNGTAQVTVNAAPAYSALTDIIGESGIALAGGTTVYWTWFPGGRPGAMVNPVQGSGVVNSAGRATISHSAAGDGLVVIGRRPGPAVVNDRLYQQFLTLA